MSQAPPSCIPPESATLLIELDSRQDELLKALDDLNRRIEQAIVSGQLCVRSAPTHEVSQPAAA